MRTFQRLLRTATIAAFFVLTGCESDADEAGEANVEIEPGGDVDTVEIRMEEDDLGDDIEGGLEEAGDKIEDAADEVGEELDEAVTDEGDPD